MAWLQRRGTNYRLCFRHDGKLYRQALGTSDEKEAEACRARLEDTLNRLERGWLAVPTDADLLVFLLSGGEVSNRRTPSKCAPKTFTLGALRDGYLSAQKTSLERDSLRTLSIPMDHIVCTLGEAFEREGFTLADLRRHADRRKHKMVAGGSRSPATQFARRSHRSRPPGSGWGIRGWHW